MANRIEFKVAYARVLWEHNVVRGWMHPGQAYVCSDIIQKVWKIKGADGCTYVWDTQQDIAIGDTIKASIKKEQDYKGEHQIVVTRGTILESV